ncbi:MAG TPA: hypothetical protein VEL03_19870 [Streptosporangiaceae bacterium]|nr:hypothetical protein [Streptosporangiaceae bacterium]
MHEIIRIELQKARVAELHRRAQQDRLEREAARQARRRTLSRLLTVLGARRSALRKFARAPVPVTVRSARAEEGAALADPAARMTCGQPSQTVAGVRP